MECVVLCGGESKRMKPYARAAVALPKMARDGVLYSMVFEGEWITVNDVKQLEVAKKKLDRFRP